MKLPRFSRASSFAVAVASLLATQAVRAADSSWNVDASGNWTDSSWSAGIPGAASGSTSADIATFDYLLTGNKTVTVDATRNIGGITFSNTSTSRFTLSSGSLLLTSGGIIQTTSGNGAHTDSISSPIQIQGNAGTAAFTAGATATNSILSISGAITGVSTLGNTTTLTLGGGNTGSNLISGDIGNGAGGGMLAVTKTGAGNWNIGGLNEYSGATNVNAGTLTILTAEGLGNATGSTTVADNASLMLFNTGMTIANEAITLSGTGAAGGGALASSSTGTTTLGGTITLAGNTRINSDGGTLSLSSTGTIGGGNHDLTLGGVGNIQIQSVLGTGTGTLTKDGSGTVTLYNNSTYTGATLVSLGVLNIRTNDALGTAAGGVTVNPTAGAALELQNNITVGNEPLDIGGTGVGSAGAMRNVSGNNTYGGALTLSADTRINSDTASTTLTLSNTAAISGATKNLTFGGLGNTTVSGAIATTSGALTKDGSGTLTLSGTNTYSGLTTVSGGTLILANGAAITNAGGVQLDNTAGALLQLTDSETIGYLTGGGSTGGNIQLQTKTLTVGDGTDRTYAGAISSTSTAGSLVKLGLGTITLSGASSYTGGTTISAGTLSIGAANNIGDGSSTNSLSIGAGQLTVTGDIDSARNVSVTNTVSTISVDSTKTYTNTGTVAGSGNLTKSDAGTLVLTGNNSYEGLTTVSAGVLNIQNSNALGGTTTGTVVNSTGALQLQGGIAVGAEALQLNGTGINSTGALRSISGNNTYGGTIKLNANSSIYSDEEGSTLTLSNTASINLESAAKNLLIGGSGNTTVTGAIATGTGALTKEGSGTLTLSDLNTYTGATTLTEGIVSVNTIGSSATAGGLGMATNAASKLVFNGGTLQYTGASSTTTRAFTINADIVATIDVTTSTSNLTFSSSNGNPTSNSGLTKLGLGTLTLSGTNKHEGATTVLGGVLNVTGSLDNSADTGEGNESIVTVGGIGSSGKPTLAGTGTINGATIIAAAGTGVVGIHSPGDRSGTASLVGTQKFNSTLTYNTGSIFEWQLASSEQNARGTGYDAVNVTGGTISGSGAVFKVVLGGGGSFSETFWNSNQTWSDIFKTSLDGSGSSISIASTFASGAVQWYAGSTNMTSSTSTEGYFTTSGTNLNWTAVPEPSSALAGLLLGAGLLRRRRK